MRASIYFFLPGPTCAKTLSLCRRSDVAALVLDASECADTDAERFTVTQQDFRLAELIAEEGRACVVVINKWDTVPNKTSNSHVTFKNEVLAQLRAISWATVLFTSASTGGAPAPLYKGLSSSELSGCDCKH